MSIVRTRRQATRASGVWAIVLAAGASLRLGRPKQLVRAARTTLVLRAVRLAEHVAPGHVIVVVGAHALRVRAHLRRARVGSTLAHNRAWAFGQSTSLRCGIAALPRNARAVLVLVVDQPDIADAALARLIRAWRRAPMHAAVSEYAGRRGVPAVFPRSLFSALEREQGDRGARRLIEQLTHVTVVPLPAAAFDVDTVEDLARLGKRRRTAEGAS